MIRRKGFENKTNEATRFPRGMRRSRPKQVKEASAMLSSSPVSREMAGPVTF